KLPPNYPPTLLPQTNPNKLPYHQLLSLHPLQQKYLQQLPTINIFFLQNPKLLTPPLNGTIFPGITRNSIIQL
uniref:aminotransferase class IV n=1 Tax=Staphylococcus epidermidis TaxID=1282 RepID=UPI001642D5EF